MTHYKWLVTIIFIVILNGACENENPVTPENFPPVLSNLSAPDTIKTGIGESAIFSVKCVDENGSEDIDSVSFKIISPNSQIITSGIMHDDGNYADHGDNVPGDGKYSIRLILNIDQGNYRFIAQASDRSHLKSNEIQATFHALPGVINQAPIISQSQLPDSVYVDEIVPFFISVRASDPDSADAISRVSYQILGPTVTQLAEEGELNDSGANGDALAGDEFYSIETTTAFASWKFGEYHLIIQAYDTRQKNSESIYVILPWAKKDIGVAPQIFDLAAPDTIKLPPSGSDARNITIKARDADHYNDIKHVFFYSIKPDSTLANNGNPFFLYDDGIVDEFKWDEVAKDSVFSIQIKFPYNTTTGIYYFEFQSVDYSALLSNKIIHRVKVIN